MTIVKFSIIMPTYNRSYCINKAIDSILAQSYQNFELIIIDDGSDDNTTTKIRSTYKGYIDTGKIKLISYIKNKGQSYARNIGLAAAENDYIAYVDSDDVIRVDFLSSFKTAINLYPSTKCFYSKYHSFRHGRHIEHSHSFDYSKLKRMNYIAIGTFVHHINLYRKYGGFDTQLQRLEDWDLILRYTKNNTPHFIDKVLLDYTISLDRVSNSMPYKKIAAEVQRKHIND